MLIAEFVILSAPFVILSAAKDLGRIAFPTRSFPALRMTVFPETAVVVAEKSCKMENTQPTTASVPLRATIRGPVGAASRRVVLAGKEAAGRRAYDLRVAESNPRKKCQNPLLHPKCRRLV
jgi:hypothetical protein